MKEGDPFLVQRDELAKKLRAEEDHKKRTEILAEEKTKPGYVEGEKRKRVLAQINAFLKDGEHLVFKDEEWTPEGERGKERVKNAIGASDNFTIAYSELLRDLGVVGRPTGPDEDKDRKERRLAVLHKVQEMQERCHGRVAIDLGCGIEVETINTFSEIIGTEAYLGVDKFHVGDTKEVSKIPRREPLGNPQVKLNEDYPALVHREDMLTALEKFKDDCAVVFFNGIEPELFSEYGDSPTEREYFKKLTREIVRVIGERGFLISTNARLLDRQSFEKDEELDPLFDRYKEKWKTFVYRKKRVTE